MHAATVPVRLGSALVAVAALLVLASACGSESATPASNTTPSTSTSTSTSPNAAADDYRVPSTAAAPTTTEAIPVVPGQVVIRDYEFLPPTVTVAVGETVTWQNTDDVDHWVLTVDKTTVDSGPITPDQAFTATPSAPGTYEYYCDIHNSMTGTIVVG